MRQASFLKFSKVVLALVLVFVNTCSGCTTRDRETSPVTRETINGQSGLRVLPTDIHNAFLKYALADRRVEACRRLFESRRLGERPASSFTIEGRNRDGILARVTVMIFLGPDPTAAGALAFLQGNEQSRVCACIARTIDGGALSERASLALTEYAVQDNGQVTPFEMVSGDTTGTGNHEGFWNCVGASSVAGTVLCTLKCLPAGPAYAECLIACTGWAILSALVGCAFAELLDNSD
jgi:hypothetical protein